MRGISRYLRVLQKNRSGFTLIEALLVTAITGIIMAGLFYVLSTGELSSTVSYTRVYVQSQARRAIDWVARDTRLAVLSRLTNPDNIWLDSHIKFRPVKGWNYENPGFIFPKDDDPVDPPLVPFEFIEYIYNGDSKTLTRNLLNSSGGVIRSWVFQDIISPPFFTFNSSGIQVPLTAEELQNSWILVIEMNVYKQARGGTHIDSRIITEVRIRNG